MTKIVHGLLAVFGLAALLSGCGSNRGQYDVVSFPEHVSEACRDGMAKVYDECSDQNLVLNKATKEASLTNKSVLVVYGAEWCIWCHVFDKYINGYSRQFTYEWEYEDEIEHWEMREKENANAEKEADKLNKYVSENFVVAHIEGYYSPNGNEVVKTLGVDEGSIRAIPFIMVLGEDGKYLSHMPASSAIKGMEKRSDSGEEYRGYDRELLLGEMIKLREKHLQERAAKKL